MTHFINNNECKIFFRAKDAIYLTRFHYYFYHLPRACLEPVPNPTWDVIINFKMNIKEGCPISLCRNGEFQAINWHNFDKPTPRVVINTTYVTKLVTALILHRICQLFCKKYVTSRSLESAQRVTARSLLFDHFVTIITIFYYYDYHWLLILVVPSLAIHQLIDRRGNKKYWSGAKYGAMRRPHAVCNWDKHWNRATCWSSPLQYNDCDNHHYHPHQHQRYPSTRRYCTASELH